MGKEKIGHEILSHTADIKIRVYGDTLEELFCNAVIGMFQAIGPKVDGCKKIGDRLVCDNLPIERKVELEAIDTEVLLVKFLSQALYLSDVNNEAYLGAKIFWLKECENKIKISAVLSGIKVKGFEVVEIKAVTYHDLKLEQIDGVWQTNIVFDI